MSLQKILLSTVFVLFLSVLGFAQPAKFMKIAVYLENKNINELYTLDIEFSNIDTDNETYMIGIVNETEIPKLEYNNFNYEILIDDMTEFFATHSQYSILSQTAEFVNDFHINYAEPKSDINSIFYSSNPNETVKLFSVQGQLLYNSALSKKSFDAQKIENGVYIFQIFVNKMPQKPCRIVILN